MIEDRKHHHSPSSSSNFLSVVRSPKIVDDYFAPQVNLVLRLRSWKTDRFEFQFVGPIATVKESCLHQWVTKQKQQTASANPFAEFMKFSAENQAPGKQVIKLEIFFFFQVPFHCLL